MKSVFHEEMTEHLAMREKTLAPSSFAANKRILLLFDRHLAERGKTERTVTEEDVTSWIEPLYAGLSRHAVASHVGFLRVFLQYLQYKGFPVYMPPYPKVPQSYVPYLFSDTELETIFRAADSVPILSDSDFPYLRMEFPMLLRMLYCCGLRLDELLSAKVGDVNFESGVILLRDTKNRKQRLVPMAEGLTDILRRYCLAMDLMANAESYLFPGKNPQKRLHSQTAERWFRTLLKDTGIYIQPEKHTRGQCLHCLRHVFTVKSFAQAEKAGRSVHDSVPFLSVYLGHFDMDGTERYLKFSPDMFPEHTALFEAYAEGIFPEARYED